MSDVFLSRYEVEQTIEVFKNDEEFTQVIITDEGITMTDSKYRQLVELLITNKATISEYTIDQLNAMTPSFLREEIVAIYGVTYISASAYKQTLYTFKYSTIKIFFRTNLQKFLPEYDFLNMKSESKIKIFIEAFMREYDRFASVIDEIYNVVDIDKTPDEYLNYLAQAVGYEREDRVLLKDASFRELIKNIVEIYKIKGTNYSFELFFNFLGFSATIKEYWFDKRFSDPSIISNPETSSSDSNFYQYYLTSTKPTDYIPDGMSFPYVISDADITSTMDVNLFNKYISDGTYTAAQLLGNVAGYPDNPYTYFKTNVIEYSITPLVVQEGDEEDEQLTAEEIAIIQRYATFLTPIFLHKNINVIAKPIEDSAAIIFPLDSYSTYQGLQPSKLPLSGDTDNNTFEWGDGYRFYDDAVPPATNGIPRPNQNLVEPGGNFIGGFWTDTYSAIYDETDGSGSLYDTIRNENLSWTQSEILDYIANLIHNNQLFYTYKNKTIILNVVDNSEVYLQAVYSLEEDATDTSGNSNDGILNNFGPLARYELEGSVNDSSDNNYDGTETVSGPIARYALDGDATDSSGNGNDATLPGGSSDPTFEAGVAGQAAHFDGSNDYITLPAAVYGAIATDSPWSISAWVNTDTLDPAETFVQPFYFANGTGIIRIGWQDTNDRFFVQYRDSDGSNIITCEALTTPTPGAWNHIVATYDGVGNLAIYIDGVQEKTASGSPDAWAATSGYIGGAAGSLNFDGLIDEVRFYSWVLNEDEVNALYNRPTSPAHYIDGKIGQAFYSRKDLEYVSLPSGLYNDFNPVNSWSISLWAKPIAGSNIIPYVSFGSSAASPGEFFELRWDYSTTKWSVVFRDSTTSINIEDPIGGASSDFVHIVVTWNATTTTLNLYINTELKDSGTGSLSSWSSVEMYMFNYATISGVLYGGPYSWDGYVDEIRFFNSVLKEEEINKLYSYPTAKEYILAGKLGNAISFDGVDDYISASSFPALGTVWSISLWAKPDNVAAGSQILVHVNDDSDTDAIRLFINSTGNFEFDCQPGELGNITTSISDDVWAHWVATYDGTTMRLYKDGAFIDNATVSVGSLGVSTVFLGALASSILPYTGSIDEVRFYDKVLSPTEVLGLYNYPSALKEVTYNPIFYTTAPKILGTSVLNYGIGNRDLLLPIREYINTESEDLTHIMYDGSPYNLTFVNLEESPLLYAGSDYSDSLEEYNSDNQITISNITADNGSGKAEITVADSYGRLDGLVSGDTIEIIYSVDRNNNDGVYIVESISNSIITLTTTLSGSNQSVNGGFIRIYESPWLFNQVQHSFLHNQLTVAFT